MTPLGDLIPNAPPMSRIVGGKEAKAHSWPWMAAMLRKPLNSQFCAGSLINNQWIMSAGHCLYAGKINISGKIKINKY